MSVAGIASTAFAQLANVQRNYQKVQGEFKQLGQDLQAGNLTQAQTDFVTLSASLASSQQTGATSAGASPTTPPTFVGPHAINQPPQPNPTTASHHRVHFRQALTNWGRRFKPEIFRRRSRRSQPWSRFGSSLAAAR